MDTSQRTEVGGVVAGLGRVGAREGAGDDEIAAMEDAALGDDLVDHRHEMLRGAAGDDAAGGFVEELVVAAQGDWKGVEIAEILRGDGGADEVAVGTAVAGDEIGGRECAVGDGGEIDGELDDRNDGLEGGEGLARCGELGGDVGGEDEAEFGFDVERAVGFQTDDGGGGRRDVDAAGFEEDAVKGAVELGGLLGGGGSEGALIAGDFGAAGELGADDALLGGEGVGKREGGRGGKAREWRGAGVEGVEEGRSEIADGGCIQKTLPAEPVEGEVAPFRDREAGVADAETMGAGGEEVELGRDVGAFERLHEDERTLGVVVEGVDDEHRRRGGIETRGDVVAERVGADVGETAAVDGEVEIGPGGGVVGGVEARVLAVSGFVIRGEEDVDFGAGGEADGADG